MLFDHRCPNEGSIKFVNYDPMQTTCVFFRQEGNGFPLVMITRPLSSYVKQVSRQIAMDLTEFFLTIWFSLLIRTQVTGKSVYHCHIHALELLHITSARKRPQHFVEETQKFKVATKQNENTILQATHERRTLIVLIIFQSL